MTQEENLNGLPREKLIEVLESFKDPEVFNAVTGPWKSRVVWQGGMRAKSYMRNHVVEMDEPGDLTATDVAASAHEQVLSAMGSCMTVGFIVNATKRGVKVQDLEITVEIADGVKVRVQRGLISTVLSKTEPVKGDKKSESIGDSGKSGGVSGILGMLFGGKK